MDEDRADAIINMLQWSLVDRVVRETLDKASVAGKKRIGDLLLKRIPEVAVGLVNDALGNYVKRAVDEIMSTPTFAATVRSAIEREFAAHEDAIVAGVVQYARERNSSIGFEIVREVLRKGAR